MHSFRPDAERGPQKDHEQAEAPASAAWLRVAVIALALAALGTYVACRHQAPVTGGRQAAAETPVAPARAEAAEEDGSPAAPATLGGSKWGAFEVPFPEMNPGGSGAIIDGSKNGRVRFDRSRPEEQDEVDIDEILEAMRKAKDVPEAPGAEPAEATSPPATTLESTTP